MCCIEDGIVRYAPLCIHTFRLIAPRKLVEAKLFNQGYHSYEEIENVPDRLRWCRYQMGLIQKEVADKIGISRCHYIDYEIGNVEYYPKEIVDKLAEVFGVSVTDFLDEYNLFLYKGQGKMIQEYRLRLGMKKKPFARWLQIEVSLLREWETEQKRISKNSWEKYFKDRIK